MNPYTAQAAKLVGVIKGLIEEATENKGITMVFGLAGALMPAMSVFQFIGALAKTEWDEFYGEVFDQAIGTEEGAIIKKIGFFEGELLKKSTDTMKEGFIAYMNSRTEEALEAA